MSSKNNLVTDDKDMIFQDLLSHKNKGLIYMVYQPQYDFNSGELVGVEALLRYKSNKFGLISPTKIVEIFEEKEAISEIDLYVVNRVFEDLSSMHIDEFKNFKVSINLSGKSLKNPKFINKILYLIVKEKIETKNIEFELLETEYLSVEDILLISENVNRLKEKGISVAIDDFGTGSSNLNLLNFTSIDKIKIDKSFLEDTEKSKKILESIFYLADALSLTTIVEGVELQSQEIFLRNFSCDIGQGFLYSKPLSLGEIQKMLDS